MINSLLALYPLHIHNITQSGILYILRVLIILTSLVKCAYMNIISLNTPNNLLPGIHKFLLYVTIAVRQNNPSTFTQYLIPPPYPEASWYWAKYSLYTTAMSSRISHCSLLISISLFFSPQNTASKQCMLLSLQVIHQVICQVIFTRPKSRP